GLPVGSCSGKKHKPGRHLLCSREFLRWHTIERRLHRGGTCLLGVDVRKGRDSRFRKQILGSDADVHGSGLRGAKACYTATVTDVSVRVTDLYSVSRSIGSRPASWIRRTNSCRGIPCGVVAPAS